MVLAADIKSGQRIGARESLILDDSWIGGLSRAFLKPLKPGDTLTRASPAVQRLRLKTLLADFNLVGNFRWYSCRRGGATHHFRCTNNMNLICHIGRWGCARTARIYLTDGLACLTDLTSPLSSEWRLQRQALRARPDYEIAVQKELLSLRSARALVCISSLSCYFICQGAL